jgi:hypothetical protein
MSNAPGETTLLKQHVCAWSVTKIVGEYLQISNLDPWGQGRRHVHCMSFPQAFPVPFLFETLSAKARQQPNMSIKSYECSIHDDGGIKVVENETAEEAIDDVAEMELSWRLDPKKSLSDWAIHIQATHKPELYHVYNVHKSVLAVGPRRSGYFAKAFAHAKKAFAKAKRDEKIALEALQEPQPIQANTGSSLQEDAYSYVTLALRTAQLCKQDSTISSEQPLPPKLRTVTAVKLEEIAALAVPDMLDYCYSSTGELNIHTSNATALHFLSVYFDVKSLTKVAQGFVMGDLDMNNFSLYYMQACVLKDLDILRHAQLYLAKNIFEIPRDCLVRILTVVDCKFFATMLSTFDQNESHGSDSSLLATRSTRLSLIVAVYCNIHRRTLSSNMFLKLTDASILPEIDIKAAMVFLELEAEMCNNRDTVDSLKERCFDVLSKSWDTECLSNAPVWQVTMSVLSGAALEYFVKLAFTNAKERVALVGIRSNDENLNAEVERLRMQSKLYTDDKILNVSKDYEEMRSEVTRLQQQLQQLREEKFYGASETYCVIQRLRRQVRELQAESNAINNGDLRPDFSDRIELDVTKPVTDGCLICIEDSQGINYATERRNLGIISREYNQLCASAPNLISPDNARFHAKQQPSSNGSAPGNHGGIPFDEARSARYVEEKKSEDMIDTYLKERPDYNTGTRLEGAEQYRDLHAVSPEMEQRGVRHGQLPVSPVPDIEFVSKASAESDSLYLTAKVLCVPDTFDVQKFMPATFDPNNLALSKGSSPPVSEIACEALVVAPSTSFPSKPGGLRMRRPVEPS